jgi:hypothetical protein
MAGSCGIKKEKQLTVLLEKVIIRLSKCPRADVEERKNDNLRRIIE